MGNKEAIIIGLLIGVVLTGVAMASFNQIKKGRPSLSSPVPSPTRVTYPENEAAISFGFEPELDEIIVGEEFVVDVMIDNKGKKMVGISLVIAYDPEFLEVSKISPGSYLVSPHVLKEEIDLVGGKIFYSIVSFQENSASTGTIATLHFKAGKAIDKTRLFFNQETEVAILDEKKTGVAFGQPGEYIIL